MDCIFLGKGYEVSNPGWPRDSETVAASRANSRAIANRGVKEVANSYAKVIGSLSTPPILIGHSFGGLLVQELLGRGIGAAAVAIDPAPIKGVWHCPSPFPRFGRPYRSLAIRSISRKRFRYPTMSFGMLLQMPFRKKKRKNSTTAPRSPLPGARSFRLQRQH